jgi:hypothetical protein
MPLKKPLRLWMNPSREGPKITLTGGDFNSYGLKKNFEKILSETKTSYKLDTFYTRYLYQFNFETRIEATAHVEDRGRYTKARIWDHSLTISDKNYRLFSPILINQHVYTFDSEDCTKKVFEKVSETYKAQLDDYESRKKAYEAEKKKRFNNRTKKKEARKIRVDSIPEKLSKREEWEKSKKVSN